jgi:hypothetical protein
MSFALALQNEKSATDVLSKLIVADIAPSTGDLSPDFIRYISAMQEIEALAPGVIKTRIDADKKLQSYEQVMSFFNYIPSLLLRIPRIYLFVNSSLPTSSFQFPRAVDLMTPPQTRRPDSLFL